jgi:hypothetical protein
MASWEATVSLGLRSLVSLELATETEANMKRLIILFAALIAAVAFAGYTFHTETLMPPPIQFKGSVTYHNGSPAPIGTKVEAYLNGVNKGQAILSQAGFYELTGNPVNFPTGTYTLQADDLVGMLGTEDCYKVQYTEQTLCNIVLRTAY